MELAPTNKTTIIEFILDSIVLKLWKLSKSMRKRVKWMLKNKNIKLLKYNPKALVLNGWVELIGVDEYGKQLSKLEKGVSNYRITTLEQLDTIKSLNKEIRCYTLDFKPDKLLFINEINFLIIKNSAKEYLDCTFKKIKSVKFINSNSAEIQAFIDKIKNIQNVQIDDSTLEKLYLNFPNIKNIHFQYVKFTKPVILPPQVNFLKTEFCANLTFLKAKSVNRLFLIGSRDSTTKIFSWIETFSSLKIIHSYDNLINFLKFLRSSIRVLDCNLAETISKSEEIEIKQKLPYLIEICCSIPIETAKNLKLRKIHPIIGGFEEISGYRPKQMQIDRENSSNLEKFPELFEKIERVLVNCDSFKLDFLPEKIKKLEIEEINIES